MSLRFLAATSAAALLISLSAVQAQSQAHSPAKAPAAHETTAQASDHGHAKDGHGEKEHAEHGHDKHAVAAEPIKLGDLTLNNPTVRATVPGASVAGGYITINNGGKEADRLVAASTPTADHMEIHEMSMDNNVMKMRQLKDGLEIPAGETVELKSGSYHLMLMKPVKPYLEGEKVAVTLEFEKAGKIDIEFNVTSAKGKAASEHSHH